MMASVVEQSQTQTAPESVDGSRGLGLSEPLLLDPHRLNEDIRLAGRVAKNPRWKLPEAKCDDLVSRLFDITTKTAVSVVTRKGDEISVDGPADANAIAAARVIVQMMGQNQADELAASKSNINVNVGMGVNLAQYEERVAGRPYNEVCAEIRAQAAAVLRRIDGDRSDAEPA
jgi:hypothetical protein